MRAQSRTEGFGVRGSGLTSSSQGSGLRISGFNFCGNLLGLSNLGIELMVLWGLMY